MKFQASYAIACTELVRFSKDTPENPAQWIDSVLYLILKKIKNRYWNYKDFRLCKCTSENP